jgi:ATP-dependent DNA helicase RecG
MDPQELRDRIAEMRRHGSDNVDVEVKRAQRGLPQDLWETVSAFANTTGGLIVLGVDESSGFAVTGVDDPAAAESQIANLCGEMEPPVRAEITTVTIDGKNTVLATVPPTPRDSRPCYRRNLGPYLGSRIRVADGNRRLTEYEIGLLISNQREPRQDQAPVPEATVEDLDPAALDAYVSRLRRVRPTVFGQVSRDSVLVRTNVLTEVDDRFVPTLAGLLSFGVYPQQFFPQLNISVVRYPTREPGVPGPHGERFLDSAVIDGAIPAMLADAVAVLKRNMQRRSLVMGLFRQDEWEYPEIALREALTNALVHRDLSIAARGTQVQVEMYPDRLVIRNPGGLYGPVGVEDLGLNGTSASRNRSLLKILADAPTEVGRTVCENVGSGIFTMRRALADAGMEPPEFHDNVATFEVVFPNHTLLDRDTIDWMSSRGLEGINGPQMIALALARRGIPLTNKSFRTATGVADSREAGRLMKDLVDRGVLTMTGTRGSATYGIADKPAAPTVDRDLTDPERNILAALARGPSTRIELETATGLGRSTMMYHLRRLREAGRVELVGKERSKNAVWRATGPMR